MRLGDEVRLQLEHLPARWSADLSVNNFGHRFRINSLPYVLRATRSNGFTTTSPTDLTVALKDETGTAIPIDRGGWIRVTVQPTAFQISPDDQDFPSEGGKGRISVQVPAQHTLALGGVPEWIRIDPRSESDANVEFRVAENLSPQQRSASITIGDAIFQVTQWRSPYVAIPYTADFSKAPVPVWDLGPIAARPNAQEPSWTLDNASGENATVSATAEGPDGSSSFVVARARSSDLPWKTQVWLPAIDTKAGEQYKASVWLKAEHPSKVGIEFARRKAPGGLCGFSKEVSVPATWARFDAEFRAPAGGCGPDENRFAIQAGKIMGRLWIAKFRLTKD